jgi:hypothetical protein
MVGIAFQIRMAASRSSAATATNQDRLVRRHLSPGDFLRKAAASADFLQITASAGRLSICGSRLSARAALMAGMKPAAALAVITAAAMAGHPADIREDLREERREATAARVERVQLRTIRSARINSLKS